MKKYPVQVEQGPGSQAEGADPHGKRECGLQACLAQTFPQHTHDVTGIYRFGLLSVNHMEIPKA